MAKTFPILSAVLLAHARWRLSSDLRALSDRYLADAGVERDGIDAFVRAVLPWPDATRSELPFAARLQGCG